MKKLAKYFIEFIKNKLYNYYRNKGKEQKKKKFFKKCLTCISKSATIELPKEREATATG